jgi:4,5-DOPA dioxygenase extradiol
MTMTSFPALFVSHGAPTFSVEPGLLGPQLTALGQSLPKPRAILVVSPHWTTQQVRVGTTAHPETIHDFGGFPRELYEIQYPAPGEPALAAHVVDVLRAAGWQASADERRGLDHGAWVPVRYLFPDGDVPVFQVSMPAGLDADTAYALGAALAPLREEGVLIVGSGSLTHNLYEFRGPVSEDAVYAREFAGWVRETVVAGDHDRLRRTLDIAPHAKRAHPTTEHFLPLLVAAGAAGAEAPVQVLDGGITYGILSMDSYVFGSPAQH